MQVIQAVFGVFHHFELAHQLHQRGHLKRIYSTWPWARLKREGIPRELVRTFPLVHTADYLLRRTPLYSAALDGRFNEANSLTFDAWTRLRIEACDAFIAISGAGLTTGPKVQGMGAKFICDRGSTHQRFQNEVMAEEHRRWQVPYVEPPAHIVRREEAIYAAADAITVPSTAARRSFERMGVNPAKLHVIPYGVRLDKFRPTDKPSTETFDVLFAGQVSLRKGVPYLLQAFSLLRHPRKTLTIAGAVQDDIRGLLSRLPTDHVIFTGSLSQADLARRMSRSHALVLPSVEEGLALVQGQAMACGCPVIATTATGAEDLFTDGEEGFIVPERDSHALAERLQRLADDPHLRARMSELALQRVTSLGGWNSYGDQWDRLLHLLTGKPADHD
ncbi:MAG TPA: glycosyltransferase [Acidobacteriaceae bacterium]|nr:glycosyltransferase [Acidobacteriaceae bacterium]